MTFHSRRQGGVWGSAQLAVGAEHAQLWGSSRIGAAGFLDPQPVGRVRGRGRHPSRAVAAATASLPLPLQRVLPSQRGA